MEIALALIQILATVLLAAGVWNLVFLLRGRNGRNRILESDEAILAYYRAAQGRSYQVSSARRGSSAIRSSKEEPCKSMRSEVFISYSRKDERWRAKVETFLSPLIRNRSISVWSDKKIAPGARWKMEIELALERAKVALLIVTPDFLASDFIAENELPPLLNAANADGLRILWIPVSDSLYAETEIGSYQAAWDPSKPLDIMAEGEQNQALREISRFVKDSAT